METANRLITTPAAAGSSSCHGASQGSSRWLVRRRGLVLGGGVAIASAAFALSQHWLTVADLGPLLFLLPCAAMMLWMMGMNHGQQTGGAQASARPDTPNTTTDVRN